MNLIDLFTFRQSITQTSFSMHFKKLQFFLLQMKFNMDISQFLGRPDVVFVQEICAPKTGFVIFEVDKKNCMVRVSKNGRTSVLCLNSKSLRNANDNIFTESLVDSRGCQITFKKDQKLNISKNQCNNIRANSSYPVFQKDLKMPFYQHKSGQNQTQNWPFCKQIFRPFITCLPLAMKNQPQM